LGQKRHFERLPMTSGLPQLTDVLIVRPKVPRADISSVAGAIDGAPSGGQNLTLGALPIAIHLDPGPADCRMAASAGQVAYRLSGAQTEQPVVEFGVRATSPPTGEDLKRRPGA
jgi:hypothetical protein